MSDDLINQLDEAARTAATELKRANQRHVTLIHAQSGYLFKNNLLEKFSALATQKFNEGQLTPDNLAAASSDIMSQMKKADYYEINTEKYLKLDERKISGRLEDLLKGDFNTNLEQMKTALKETYAAEAREALASNLEIKQIMSHEQALALE